MSIGITVFSCAKDESVEPGTTVKKEIIRPSGVISPERAAVLNDEWTKTRVSAINKARTEPDNRSDWWSLEDMRNYLDYAENQATELGYQVDGVRVYYAAYPENDLSENAGNSTIFMMPTGDSLTNKNVEFLRPDNPGSGYIPGVDGLNRGTGVIPPGAGYPN
ncbi:hypothetical protein [uncultured Lacinutrix sp.]|uniref:hypothetical protein n=1 Tax=uncultured Lacinutrix sp. TaxID=574032 RepID=UPI0026348185|nr:hypothetical protein [uncultured Lacinutrix sp.]